MNVTITAPLGSGTSTGLEPSITATIRLIEYNIINYLLEHPALSALIDDRLDPRELSQNSDLPAVIYRLISKSRQTSWNDRFLRLQFDCYGETDHETRRLSRTLSKAIKSIDGQYKIFAVYIDNEMDWEPQNPGELYRVMLDAVFYYNERQEE